MNGNKKHVLVPVSQAHAEYIERFKEELEKHLGKNQITTRYATEVLQQMLPKNIKISEVIINNKKHLNKDRTVEIHLKYKIGEM